jgi:hypothetical protein
MLRKITELKKAYEGQTIISSIVYYESKYSSKFKKDQSYKP